MIKPTDAKKTATDLVAADDKKLNSPQACLDVTKTPIMRSFSIFDFSV